SPTLSSLPPVLEHLRARASTDARFKATAQEPFDLAYLPTNAQGVLVIRPAAIFAQPGMVKAAVMLNAELFSNIAMLGLKGRIMLSAEEIDWISMPLTLKKNSFLATGVWAIRTVKDFDWLKQMKALAPSLKEVRDGAHTYYCIPK